MIRLLATYKKLSTGKWQAQIAISGVRRAKSFPSKTAAKDWAARQEYLISTGEDESVVGVLRELFDKYTREVSPTHKGARWEIVRLEKFKCDTLSDTRLADLTPAILARWRDGRLKEVSAGSVIREMNLISAVLAVARREWGLIKHNPMSDVRPRQSLVPVIGV